MDLVAVDVMCLREHRSEVLAIEMLQHEETITVVKENIWCLPRMTTTLDRAIPYCPYFGILLMLKRLLMNLGVMVHTLTG